MIGASKALNKITMIVIFADLVINVISRELQILLIRIQTG